jgi:cytidylate kinase
MNQPLPRIVTFDGEARSGKGTIVQHTKDYLRDERGHKVMLIDLGQVFRVLVVSVARATVNLEDPAAIDEFLNDEQNAEAAVQLVKDVYHMSKYERDALLYTNDVSFNSAKVAARPLSQEFKDDLLRKWLRDAREEGFDTVLLDGRALEETGTMLVSHGLCDFVAGLYFVCDGRMGARRTLGFAATQYEQLSSDQQQAIDELIEQINERNEKDRNRAVQPVVPPLRAPTCKLPDMSAASEAQGERPMVIVDTSAEMTKDEMSQPVAEYVANILEN